MGEDIIICTNRPDRYGELREGRRLAWFGWRRIRPARIAWRRKPGDGRLTAEAP